MQVCPQCMQLAREHDRLKVVTASAVAQVKDENCRLQQENAHLREQLEWWQSQSRINAAIAKSAVEAW